MQTKWNGGLHAALVMAVADVLQRHGLHPDGASEDSGWTVNMVQDFAKLMEKQVNEIEANA
jgi:hypothetical protein